MVGVVLSLVLAAGASIGPVAPLVEPPRPRQGDVVVFRFADPEIRSLDAWSGSEAVPVVRTEQGWLAVAAYDMLAAPGPREVTGTVTKAGRAGSMTVPWRAAFTLYDADFPVQQITLKDDSKVNLSDEDGLRAMREQKAVAALFASRRPREWSGSFYHPLEAAPAGGRFGSRRVINGQPRNPHSGADYGVPRGTPVRSANAGSVVLAEEHFFAGNSVFVDHGDGLITMYFHLDSIAVKAGQKVARGAVIGTVGSTGRSSGPHLHFGVRYRGARVNPASLLEAKVD